MIKIVKEIRISKHHYDTPIAKICSNIGKNEEKLEFLLWGSKFEILMSYSY